MGTHTLVLVRKYLWSNTTCSDSLLLLLQAIKLTAKYMWRQLLLPVPLSIVDSGQCVCNKLYTLTYLVTHIW